MKQTELNVVLNQVKYLMKELQDIYDNLSDKNEIVIIERYGNYTKRFSAVLLSKIMKKQVCFERNIRHKQFLRHKTLKFFFRERKNIF